MSERVLLEADVRSIAPHNLLRRPIKRFTCRFLYWVNVVDAVPDLGDFERTGGLQAIVQALGTFIMTKHGEQTREIWVERRDMRSLYLDNRRALELVGEALAESGVTENLRDCDVHFSYYHFPKCGGITAVVLK